MNEDELLEAKRHLTRVEETCFEHRSPAESTLAEALEFVLEHLITINSQKETT